MNLNEYLENINISESLKKLDTTVQDNFVITDSGESTEQRYKVWSLADRHPKIIAVGKDENELHKLLERFKINKNSIFNVQQLKMNTVS